MGKDTVDSEILLDPATSLFDSSRCMEERKSRLRTGF